MQIKIIYKVYTIHTIMLFFFSFLLVAAITVFYNFIVFYKLCNFAVSAACKSLSSPFFVSQRQRKFFCKMFFFLHFEKKRLLLHSSDRCVIACKHVWPDEFVKKVAQSMFQNKCTTFTMQKSSQKTWASWVIKKLPKLNNRPIGENSHNLVTLLVTENGFQTKNLFPF
jgi:hypothetical protein